MKLRFGCLKWRDRDDDVGTGMKDMGTFLIKCLKYCQEALIEMDDCLRVRPRVN